MPPRSALVYAFGGGAGHLVRARALRHSLALERLAILCAHQAIPTEGPAGHGLELHRAPPELQADVRAFGSWIEEAIERFHPKSFFVDTFPTGILGELLDLRWPSGMERVLVGRILGNRTLEGLATSPIRYDRILLTEPVSERQLKCFARIGPHPESLELIDPPGADPNAAVRWRQGLPSDGHPLWLVVHSGPDDETMELLEYARATARLEGVAPLYAVVTQGPFSDESPAVFVRPFHPAHELYPHVDRIITACGANAMRQSRPWAGKHICLPLPRPVDDQFLRKKLFAS